MQNQFLPSGLENLNSTSDWLWPHSPKYISNNTFWLLRRKCQDIDGEKWEWGWAEELCRS